MCKYSISADRSSPSCTSAHPFLFPPAIVAFHTASCPNTTQQLSRLNTESVCIANRLRHTVFTNIRAVFLADSIWLHRGTTFIRCICIPTRPHMPFTHIHTRTPTEYRACSPEAVKAHFGFFRDFCIISYRY